MRFLNRFRCVASSLLALLTVFFWLLTPRVGAAQPFGSWLFVTGGAPSYVEVAHHASLNPTQRMTIEAWVSLTDANGGNCSSIVGKNWQQSWWVGICDGTLRSYMNGTNRDGGALPGGVFTHIAVVFTGSRRIHYINGEVALNVAQSGPLATSTAPMRIGSDVQWEFAPSGSIDDVRIWNTARTQAQIRQTINREPLGTQPGLVAYYRFQGNVLDSRGSRHGTVVGSQTGFLELPSGAPCVPEIGRLCLQNRFAIGTQFRTSTVPGSPFDGFATTPIASTIASGILAFPVDDAWQVLANAINACTAPTPHFTLAITSPSSLFTRTEVYDRQSGVNRVYFHWPGPPTASILDTTSFVACP